MLSLMRSDVREKYKVESAKYTSNICSQGAKVALPIGTPGRNPTGVFVRDIADDVERFLPGKCALWTIVGRKVENACMI